MANYLFAIVVLSCVLNLGLTDVLKFIPKLGLETSENIKTIENDYEMLMRLLKMNTVPERYQSDDEIRRMGGDPSTRLTEFHFDDCGGSAAKINYLNIGPDPLQFPGTLIITANVTVNTTLVSPIMGKLKVQKKILGEYVTIPCIDQMGSCTYDDVCSLLQQIGTCPPFLEKIGCHCPYKVGSYILPETEVEIDAAFLPSGDYKVQANLTHEGKQLKCLMLMFSVV